MLHVKTNLNVWSCNYTLTAMCQIEYQLAGCSFMSFFQNGVQALLLVSLHNRTCTGFWIPFSYNEK